MASCFCFKSQMHVWFCSRPQSAFPSSWTRGPRTRCTRRAQTGRQHLPGVGVWVRGPSLLPATRVALGKACSPSRPPPPSPPPRGREVCWQLVSCLLRANERSHPSIRRTLKSVIVIGFQETGPHSMSERDRGLVPALIAPSRIHTVVPYSPEENALGWE